ncbi:DUF6311 domain-containing protein [uncultured Aquimonas sp.]|uniref:DUF6311 domain-containing protein n=1 Tax=uncultured Aquimonas sp. TaxID=385483 RepID=UPI002624B369|nr:DUF6311 domain-containing protein [uncultured Aquimonas sp.]
MRSLMPSLRLRLLVIPIMVVFAGMFLISVLSSAVFGWLDYVALVLGLVLSFTVVFCGHSGALLGSSARGRKGLIEEADRTHSNRVVGALSFGMQGAFLFVAGCGLGLVVFVHQVGMSVVWPTDSSWIVEGDRLQHHLGWEYFRRSPWAWPPGKITDFPYPVGSSVVYTDSLPLMAIGLKLISEWLPPSVQYLGVVLLLAWVLQAGVAASLAWRAGLPPVLSLAAAGVFVLQPVLLNRVVHESLTWHWLLLAGFWLLLVERSQVHSARVWSWYLLCATAALVHPYLAVMVLALFAVFVASLTTPNGDVVRLRGVIFIGGAGVLVLFWYLSGAFVLRGLSSMAGVEMGAYSSNLLAPIDSGGASRWFGGLPLSSDGQFEGRAYPGSGGWLMILSAAVLLWRDPDLRLRFRTASWFWLGMLMLLAAVFAVGPRPAIGSWVVFDLSFATPRILEIFHASGRFVWIPLYALLVGALLVLSSRMRFAFWVIPAALVLQLVELAPRERAGDVLYREGVVNSLEEPAWVDRLVGRRQLVLLPARLCGSVPIDDMQAARIALKYGLLVNSAYLARYNGRALREDCNSRFQKLMHGQWDPGSVYVLGDPFWAELRSRVPLNFNCEDQGDYVVCSVLGSVSASSDIAHNAVSSITVGQLD